MAVGRLMVTLWAVPTGDVWDLADFFGIRAAALTGLTPSAAPATLPARTRSATRGANWHSPAPPMCPDLDDRLAGKRHISTYPCRQTSITHHE